jgi:hypothetical protein
MGISDHRPAIVPCSQPPFLRVVLASRVRALSPACSARHSRSLARSRGARAPRPHRRRPLRVRYCARSDPPARSGPFAVPRSHTRARARDTAPTRHASRGVPSHSPAHVPTGVPDRWPLRGQRSCSSALSAVAHTTPHNTHGSSQHMRRDALARADSRIHNMSRLSLPLPSASLVPLAFSLEPIRHVESSVVAPRTLEPITASCAHTLSPGCRNGNAHLPITRTHALLCPSLGWPVPRGPSRRRRAAAARGALVAGRPRRLAACLAVPLPR